MERSPRTKQVVLATSGVLFVSSAVWLVVVWTADAQHGPFGLWDATCHGQPFAYATRRYRLAYSSGSLVAVFVGLAVLARAARRDGLGCLLILSSVLSQTEGSDITFVRYC